MFTGTLKPYQDTPVDKFLDVGHLLAVMAMGTGKTVVAIAAAEELLGCGDINLNLCVVPAGIKYQWAKRIAQFTDIKTAKKKRKNETVVIPAPPYCVIIDGSPKQRAKQYAMIGPETDYVICGYSNIEDDAPFIRRLHPGMVTLDECSQISGASSNRSKFVKRRLGKAEYRMGLTGTPMENGKPEELYSIMQWIDPEVLGHRADIFDDAFVERDPDTGAVTRWKHTDVLHEIMEPHWFRCSRDDPDVRPFMPEEERDEWEVELDEGTRAAYEDIASDLLEGLQSVRGRPSSGFSVETIYGGAPAQMDSRIGQVMARHQAAEQLLDHPDVLIASARDYEDTRRGNEDDRRRFGSRYAFQKWQEGIVDDLTGSPKLDRLKAELDELLGFDDRTKVLVYTRWRPMLDILDHELAEWPHVLYHGELSASAKDAAISRFEQPGQRLFLSTHAGAYGCDMYMASHLVNYDLPWESGKKGQIDSRHVRSSSEFSKVFVHDMITRGTVEERKMALLRLKARVADAIIEGRGADEYGSVANDMDTLTEFLEGTIL